MPAALVLPSQPVTTAHRHLHSYVYYAYGCHVFPFYAPVTRTCAGGSYIGEAAEVALVFSRPPARYGQPYPLQPLSVDIFCVTSTGVGKTLTSHRSRYISSSRLSFHRESMKGLRCPSINQYGHFLYHARRRNTTWYVSISFPLWFWRGSLLCANRRREDQKTRLAGSSHSWSPRNLPTE